MHFTAWRNDKNEKEMMTIEQANKFNEELADTMVGYLKMKILPSNDDTIRAQMPVDNHTCQNYRFLHGGASLAFAETVAGIGSYHITNREMPICGAQVCGNHIRPVPVGQMVYAKATLLQGGNSLHVWDVEITNEQGMLVSTERVTNYVIRKNQEQKTTV